MTDNSSHIDWQPIETAPHNGDTVLLWNGKPNFGRYSRGCWQTESMWGGCYSHWASINEPKAEGPRYNKQKGIVSHLFWWGYP